MILPVGLPQLQLVVLWSTNMEICKPEKQHQKIRFIALKWELIAWEFAKLKEHQQFNLKVGFFTITLHQNLIGVEVIDGRVLVNRQMEKGRPR